MDEIEREWIWRGTEEKLTSHVVKESFKVGGSNWMMLLHTARGGRYV